MTKPKSKTKELPYQTHILSTQSAHELELDVRNTLSLTIQSQLLKNTGFAWLGTTFGHVYEIAGKKTAVVSLSFSNDQDTLRYIQFLSRQLLYPDTDYTVLLFDSGYESGYAGEPRAIEIRSNEKFTIGIYYVSAGSVEIRYNINGENQARSLWHYLLGKRHLPFNITYATTTNKE